MKKKSKRNLIIAIIVAIAILLLLNYSKPSTMSPSGAGTTTQTGTTIIDNGSQRAGYKCPSSGVTYCNVKGVIDCTLKRTEAARVVARTTTTVDSLGRRGWFAIINSIGNGLESYCPATTLSASSVQKIRDVLLPYSMSGFIGTYSSREYLFIPYANEANKYYRYQVGSCGADLNPLSEYDCQNQEKCEGNVLGYNCSGDFFINNVKQESLAYSSVISSGSDETRWYKLNPGDTASITGGDDNHIQYEAINQYEVCYENVCKDETGYIACVNNRPGDFVPCTGILKCSNGKCAPPISQIEVTTKDSSDVEKTGFAPDEPINIYVKIVSNSQMSVNVSLRDSSPVGKAVWSEQRTITSGNAEKFTTSLSKDKSNIKFYIVLAVSFSGINEKYYYGDEASEEHYVRTSTPIMNSVSIRSPNQSRLFINTPVWVEVSVSDGTMPAQPDKINLVVKFKGIPQTIPQYGTPIDSGASRVFKYVFSFPSAGLVEATSTVERLGYVSPPSSFSTSIEDSVITPEFTNINLLRCVPIATPQILTFNTTDSSGNSVDATNVLTVTLPSGKKEDISKLITKVPNTVGEYQYQYSFDTVGGYTFTIVSTATGYNVGSSPILGTLEAKTGCTPDQCTTSSDCPIGEICNNGKCENPNPPWVLYLIIVGIAAFIIILIVVILSFRKKKQVNLGGF